ncbi:endolytic transglycosylase MltG [Halalkalibacter alkaliphilus]|uniref:Endolytic murein transglycosylase n=1 Tax=Halalkalibacter alkaliphilus TaxID=2917993 RepID=A0A9X2A0C1_9BACI|nr:endolytic transglycosylase MltG [Halalkalibacter alkaliphilus]MCL7746917.1 endolytic transglycosylase MltG [Halalkalibacter alkaliphilus]
MSNSNEKPRNELYEERVSQARVVRRIVFFSLIGLFLIGIITLIIAYFYVTNMLGPVDSDNPEKIQVTIPIGSTANQIGTILEEEGLVRSGTMFRYYVRYKNESGFQAGDYALSTAMTMDDIIAELKEGRVLQEPELVFTVPEGRWLEDVAEIIARETDHSEEEVMEVLTDQEYIEVLIDQYSMLTEDILEEDIRYALEGYLFPARYDFMDESPTIQSIVEAMLSGTQSVLEEFSTELEQSEYSVHEILTLASIIEREAQKSEDRYLISGVLYNRLDRDMRLQVDPTVSYALGEHLYMTSYAALEVDSPYNTYRYAGIPIGPIANPGKDSIRAALNPEETDYLFFYARFNGEVIYNETYEEHNRTHQRYRNEWVEGQSTETEEE